MGMLFSYILARKKKKKKKTICKFAHEEKILSFIMHYNA